MRSMLCPTVIGRGAELDALAGALDRAADGNGGVFFLAGDAGIGKSRLATEATSLAAPRGFGVLIGRATESAVPVPFRPIAEALMKLARARVVPDTPEMARHLPALASLVPEWNRPGDEQAEISPLICGEALIRVLTPTESKGSLLVLEDLHWADPETLAIVEYLADNLADANVLCVATVRDSEPSPGLDCVRSLTARRAAPCIDVHRLPDWAILRMARECLDAEQIPDQVVRLLADCDGLPFAVEELLAAAVSSGPLVGAASGWRVNDRVSAGVPASIAGSVRNRLAVLGPVVIDVLASAAVLGRKFDWTLLPSIAGLAEPPVLEALAQGALSTATASLADARELVASAAAAEPMLAIEIDEALVDALAHAGDYTRLVPAAVRLVDELEAAGADPRRQALAMITVARTNCENHCGASAAQLAAARSIADR